MLATTTASPATGRGFKVRRITAEALPRVADLIDHLAFLAMIGLAVTSIGNLGPAWAQLNDGAFTVAVFALFGASRFVEGLFTSVSDALDPGTTDGDPAHLAACVLRGLASDLDNGADNDDVRIAIQDSRVLAEAGDLLFTLAVNYRASGDPEPSAAFGTAADHVYRAARELGDKQV
ncbi:hypothetical protein E4198_00110 [Streptomyces sp. RKND-216]|uniref:hypothetical protein n=1 Tax=Streptomyces sp. RKND-216 TaxID=2562581 RepID=UPI00109D90FA|nr:hypothetical protein [Streptomyces sp. RKND-216]THA28253.1 hypothetical protein E4198_00110 [Streptomyces sp. RKND-216]